MPGHAEDERQRHLGRRGGGLVGQPRSRHRCCMSIAHAPAAMTNGPTECATSLALAGLNDKARAGAGPVQPSREALHKRADLERQHADGERPAPPRARHPAHLVPELFAQRPRGRRAARRPARAGGPHRLVGCLDRGRARTSRSSIREALDTADVVIVLWSKSAIESDWVRDEAAQGRDRHRLVPLSIDGSAPPLGFRQYQVIDLSRWRGDPAASEMAAILRAVAIAAGQPALPVPTAHRQCVARWSASRRQLLAGAGAGGLVVGGGALLACAGRVSAPTRRPRRERSRCCRSRTSAAIRRRIISPPG